MLTMKSTSLLTRLPRAEQSGARLDPLLEKDGYTGVLVTLTGEETLEFDKALTRQDHLVFVVDGGLSVEMDGIVSLVNRHDALLVPRGKRVAIKNLDVKRSKFLRFDVPPRPERAPLYAFPEEV
jgi:hypothetical protein